MYIDWSKTAGSTFISWDHDDTSTRGKMRKTSQRQCFVWSVIKLTSKNWHAPWYGAFVLETAPCFFGFCITIISLIFLALPDSGESKTPENFWSTRICFLLCEEFERWEIWGKQIIPVKSGGHHCGGTDKWGRLCYLALLSVFLWSPLSFWINSAVRLFTISPVSIVKTTQVD